jgi:hypothetical protein
LGFCYDCNEPFYFIYERTVLISRATINISKTFRYNRVNFRTLGSPVIGNVPVPDSHISLLYFLSVCLRTANPKLFFWLLKNVQGSVRKDGQTYGN